MGLRILPVATIFETLLPLNALGADAITALRIGADVKVTQHPIEIGTDVADHAQVMGQRISFTHHRTLTPFLSIANPMTTDRAIRFFEGIRGKLVTIVLPRAGTFVNMTLEHFDYPIENAQRISINCVFRQVNIADAISVPIPVRAPSPDLQVSAPTPVDAGAQATEAAAPAANTSLAATALDAIRGVTGG